MYNSITPADIMHFPLHGENALQIVADGHLTTVYTMDVRNQSIQALGTPWIQNLDVKALLRPITHLHKPIVKNDCVIMPMDYIFGQHSPSDRIIELFKKSIKSGSIPYRDLQKLWELHFDTTGLIEAGKALNLNTYKK